MGPIFEIEYAKSLRAKPQTFIRFVVGTERDHHRAPEGVIRRSTDYQEAGVLEPYEYARLEKLFRWLNKNLPVPPFSRRNWSTRAVCWFKDDASESIQRVWEIVILLRQHGAPIRMLTSKNPGKLLYEDAYQIVTETWERI